MSVCDRRREDWRKHLSDICTERITDLVEISVKIEFKWRAPVEIQCERKEKKWRR